MIPKNQIATLTSLVKDLGKEVEIIKSRNFDYETKSDGSPLTEADKFVNENLIKFFRTTKFQNIISEESKETPYSARKMWEYCWVIDPIDGTKEFIKKEDDYTINIALCKKGRPIFSIVYAPARKEFFHAESGKGAYKNDSKIFVQKVLGNNLNVIASRSHLNESTMKFIKDLGKSFKVNLLQFGSSIKICKIAEGVAHVYPRFGPTMEWDTCAADLILKESGGVLYGKDHDELTYNKQNLLNPFFIATSKKLKL